MSKNIIFIGGVHGVGKTTLCNKLSNKYKIPHHSSSDLISRMKNSYDTSNKNTKDIGDNQNILLNSIKEFCPDDKKFILDGHFTLLDYDGCICRIPKQTFIELNLNCIIILRNSSENIIKNLSLRDSKNYTLEFITKFQNEELMYAEEISRFLNIDYKVFDISSDLYIMNKYMDNALLK